MGRVLLLYRAGGFAAVCRLAEGSYAVAAVVLLRIDVASGLVG